MKLLAPIGLLIVVLAVVIRADDTPTDADLVFVNQNEVFTLDPQRMSYVQDLRLAQALYEGLARWNNHTFAIEPAAAELPSISEDGRTYTFRLRPNARWSNGDPVVADDFVYAWRRAILPDTAADYSNLFFAIDGAREFFRWRLAQTGGFVADPWDDPSPEAVRLLCDRFDALLNAGDLPPEIARPAPAAIEAIRAELAILRSAAESTGSSLEVELDDASACRDWHAALDEAESRRGESHWMWANALQRFEETVGIRALDRHTLEVRLDLPMTFFGDLICFGPFFPVHQPTVEGWPDDAETTPPFSERRWVNLNATTGRFEQRHEWARPAYHVGNGPYLLAEWRYKRDLRLERSPTFHDQELIRNDSVLALTIEDTNTAVLAFESGRVDWLAEVSTEYEADMVAQLDAYLEAHAEVIERERARGRDLADILAELPAPTDGQRRNIHVFPTFGTSFFSFNCRDASRGAPENNPFTDARVRRAFTMAIDKQSIVDRVTRMREPVATTLIPPGSIPGYQSPAGLPFDIERARRELADAGWEDRDRDGFIEDESGAPFPVVDLLYTTNLPRYRWVCLNLKSQWEAALGVRVELRGVETKFFKEHLKEGRFMIARGRWYGDYGDPTTFLELFRSTDGNNDRGYVNDEVDGWLDEAKREIDPEKRLRMLEEIEAFLMDEEVPLMPVYQLSQVYMFEPGRVRGLSTHPRLTQFLFQMEVREP